MKILIDSNVYLDFYRSNNEALKILDQIIENSDEIILTDQIIQEFYRNRAIVLRTILLKFEKETNVENISSSFLKSLGEFSDLIEIQKKFNDSRKKVKQRIQKMIDYQNEDHVFLKFRDLVDKLDGKTLLTNKKIIEKAQKRKLIGNPPTSNKYSIGDEINWELILQFIDDDLILVGRDKTFKENFNFLKVEFHKNTGKIIYKLEERITTALSSIKISIDEDLFEIEKNQIEEIRIFDNFWITDNEEIISIVCRSCGEHGQWDGNKCKNCGFITE